MASFKLMLKYSFGTLAQLLLNAYEFHLPLSVIFKRIIKNKAQLHEYLINTKKIILIKIHLYKDRLTNEHREMTIDN